MNKKVIRKDKQKKEISVLDKISTPPYAYLFIWLVLIIIYGQVVTFFLGKFDEEGIILSNLEFLKDFSNIGQAFFQDAFFSDKGVEFYRPLQNISFMLDAHLSGDNGWGYYLMNLLLHGTTCCLLFYLFMQFDADKKLAWSVTIVFAANPLFVHLIAWAPSRGDLLIGMFGVLSYIYFRKFIQTGRLVFLSVNVFAFLFAMLSKESAIFFPLIFLIDYFLVEKNRNVHIRRLFFSIIPCLLVVLLYFILRHKVVLITTSDQVFGLVPLIHNFRVLLEYPGKFVFPLFLAPMPSYSMVNTLLGVLVVSMILFGLFRYRPANFSIYLFSAAWFFLFVLPGMMYTHEFGSAAYDYLEHRAYLPLMGFILFTFTFLLQIQERFKTPAMPYLVLLSAMIYSISAFFYVKNYENPQTFYDLAVRTNPSSAMAYNNRGLVSASFKDFQGAIQNYETALKLKPDYAEVYVNRGMCYSQMDNKKSAIEDYTTAIKIKPGLFQAHYNMANIRYDMGQFDDALKEYVIALRIHPTYYQGYIARGSLYFKINDYKAAINDFSKAISFNPVTVDAYLNRGKCRYLANDTLGACKDWELARGFGSKDAQSLLDSYCK
jgi:tetratricopeptide (TPR) repeat protein